MDAAQVCLGFAASVGAMAQPLETIRVDNWLSFQRNTDNSGQWLVQPRAYIPVSLSRGWRFTQRVDLPVSYTDESGTDNPSGGWKAGIGDWFVEEIITTPALAENFRPGRASGSSSRRVGPAPSAPTSTRGRPR